MQPGDTYRRNSGSHLQVIVSDPVQDRDQVVVISITSCRNSKHDDPACILQSGEHPFVKHDSFMNYAGTRLLADRVLDQQLSSGQIQTDLPVSLDLLKKIRQGAIASDRTPMNVCDLLRKQKLVSEED